MVFEEITEEELEDLVREVQIAQSEATSAEERFHRAIVELKDLGGLTFREIGEITETAHSWIYKIYKRQKDKESKDEARLRRHGAGGGSLRDGEARDPRHLRYSREGVLLDEAE